MDRIKKNFGFGCMRLPMSGDEVDKVQMCQMVVCVESYGSCIITLFHYIVNDCSSLWKFRFAC